MVINLQSDYALIALRENKKEKGYKIPRGVFLTSRKGKGGGRGRGSGRWEMLSPVALVLADIRHFHKSTHSHPRSHSLCIMPLVK